MELRQLRYFVRIIETGSMGSAAQDLDIGVSALSQQMSRLENELAIRLLQRTSRGVTPTNAGLAFYSQAQLALRHADDAILAARRSAPFRSCERRNGPQYRLHTGYTVYPCHAGKLCRCSTACGGKLVR